MFQAPPDLVPNVMHSQKEIIKTPNRNKSDGRLITIELDVSKK